MTDKLPDYFAPPPSDEEALLRLVKGETRRRMIENHLRSEPLDAIPEQWRQHDLDESFKNLLGTQNPSDRGGEDLPDLLPGEVEIARMNLVDSVHGEVTSLRAKKAQDGTILLRLVDEYETEYTLPESSITQSLTAEEALGLFEDAEPAPLSSDCQMAFSSFFYPDLDDLARRLGILPS